MALQVPGLFTSIIAAIVAPRNTSSDIKRAGPGLLIWVGAAVFMVCPVPTLWVFRLQRKEEVLRKVRRRLSRAAAFRKPERRWRLELSLKSPRSPATSALAFELGLRDIGFCFLPPVFY